ncbi:MAG: hypothetical protein J1F65_06370 [Clostridiales bacterium]|nr:hypothetical protein [Clostridiales bacterium]
MKIKKVLNEEKKRIDSELLEEGQDLYQDLVSKYCVSESKTSSKSNFSKRRLFVSISVSLVVVLVIAAVWIFYPTSEIQYFADDEARIDVTMEDFLNDTNNTVHFDESVYSIENLVKVYDQPTNDTLYYDIMFLQVGGLARGKISIVVNSHYQYVEKFEDERQRIVWHGIEIEYSESSQIVNGIPISDFFGKFSIKSYVVYFSYKDVTGFSTPDTILNDLMQIN